MNGELAPRLRVGSATEETLRKASRERQRAPRAVCAWTRSRGPARRVATRVCRAACEFHIRSAIGCAVARGVGGAGGMVRCAASRRSRPLASPGDPPVACGPALRWPSRRDAGLYISFWVFFNSN